MIRQLSLFSFLFGLLLYSFVLAFKQVYANPLQADYVFLGSMYNCFAALLVHLLVESMQSGSRMVGVYSLLLFSKLPVLLLGLYFISEQGSAELLSTLFGLLSFIPMIFLYQKFVEAR